MDSIPALSAGESLTIHDPKPPTAVQFQFNGKCPGGGVIEMDKDARFRTPKISAGREAANMLVQPGGWAYRLRCGDNGAAVAHIETNGTLEPPAGIDWICVSPKARAPWTLRRGDELKLVYPQEGLAPDDVGEVAFGHFWLQPMDGPARAANTARAVRYCLAHPRWRLSLQTHKLIGIP